MISEAELAHWRSVVPWVERSQVEQDLVLSRLIIEIAQHPLLGSELVFRGGTCFHKLWLDRPWRYSEDLDYVRRSATGVGEVFDALSDVATAVGFDDIATQVGRHPKVRLRSTLVDGGRLQVKIEMNTFERSPARPTVTRRSGFSEVPARRAPVSGRASAASHRWSVEGVRNVHFRSFSPGKPGVMLHVLRHL